MGIYIVREKRGILLGIIFYLTRHHELLKKKTIIIQHDKYHKIITKLFTELNIKKYQSSDDDFVINIQNNVRNGLIINNLNNINKIKSDKVTLLPWYDRNNPIVMFEYHKHRHTDINETIKRIENFSETERFEGYKSINFIEAKCKIRFWDTYAEHNILKHYSKLYKVSKIHIFKYIERKLHDHLCKPTKYMQMPIHIPVKIPVEIPIITDGQIKKEIIDKGEICKDYVNLVYSINDKLGTTNELLDEKIKL